MGRRAGYLALYVGISVGATAVLIPERPMNFDEDIVEKIRRARLSGTTHYMIVVAEGAGSALEIGKRIHEEIGIDPRVTVLGHIQRGGSPSARDRETASRMGYQAVQALVQDRGNCIIATQDGRIVDLDMEDALKMTKNFEMDRYQVLEALTNSRCAEMKKARGDVVSPRPFSPHAVKYHIGRRKPFSGARCVFSALRALRQPAQRPGAAGRVQVDQPLVGAAPKSQRNILLLLYKPAIHQHVQQ